MQSLEDIARQIRVELVRLHNRTNASHIGSEFSALDVMVLLYYEVMDITPQNFPSKDRDFFILSKGHAAPALYALLYRRGFITKEAFDSYGSNGTVLAVHPSRDVYGVDAASGSLGHGLSIGSGIALALRKLHPGRKVYVLLSDGECEEGSTVEAAVFAGRMGLDNLVAVVDNNGLQAYDPIEAIQDMSSTKAKFESSGWEVREVNGHSYPEMREVFRQLPFKEGRPSLIVAHTVKGKGVKEMEGKIEWHYKAPSDSQVRRFVEELGGQT
jgi:transketolase